MEDDGTALEYGAADEVELVHEVVVSALADDELLPYGELDDDDSIVAELYGLDSDGVE
jgi:hypothetical protein